MINVFCVFVFPLGGSQLVIYARFLMTFSIAFVISIFFLILTSLSLTPMRDLHVKSFTSHLILHRMTTKKGREKKILRRFYKDSTLKCMSLQMKQKRQTRDSETSEINHMKINVAISHIFLLSFH